MTRPNAPSCRIGLDIGGTTTTAIAVSTTGMIVGRACHATPAASGPDAVLGNAADLAKAAAGEHAITEVFVGAAGVVDPLSGRVLSSTDAITGWSGTNIADGLASRIHGGPRVRARNDVHAFVAGEAARGAGVGRSSVLGVTVGTGIGGALVIGHTLIEGSRHVAGHLGHIPVAQADGLMCACGRIGHLEAIASGTAIQREHERVAGTTGTVKVIADRARHGDLDALAVLRIAGEALGTALAGVAAVLDPDIIVIGGGVWGAGAVLHKPVELAFRSAALPMVATTPIVPALLGDDAVALGAIESFNYETGDDR